MPLPCRRSDTTFTANTQYAVRHNPPAYLVSPPIGAPNADCTSNDVPLGSTTSGKLLTALNTGALKKFSYVTPGICHDMHNAPTGSTCVPANVVTAGDNWLKQWMPKIFASPDYTSGKLSVARVRATSTTRAVTSRPLSSRRARRPARATTPTSTTTR